MVFVNEIGQIVHGIVDKYSGAANKNIGDSFLLVWKFEKEQTKLNFRNGELELTSSLAVSQICEMSMISFLKIIAALKKSYDLQKYKNHEKLNQRLKNYEVTLGFGLHLGWAIEGAIGSYYKIDASYLGSNVNMAMKLEAATKSFGVPLLVSG